MSFSNTSSDSSSFPNKILPFESIFFLKSWLKGTYVVRLLPRRHCNGIMKKYVLRLNCCRFYWKIIEQKWWNCVVIWHIYMCVCVFIFRFEIVPDIKSHFTEMQTIVVVLQHQWNAQWKKGRLFVHNLLLVTLKTVVQWNESQFNWFNAFEY